MYGADTTVPSSTTPSRSGGCGLWWYLSYIMVVMSPNAFVPAPSTLMLTSQSFPVWLGWAPAEVIMVPSTFDLSRTYLLSAASQDTILMLVVSFCALL